MDRSWITASRISDDYENGVEEFLQFAKRNGIGVNNKYYCLCVNCVNVIRQDIELIREHVLCDGFLKSYTIWTWHGEVLDLVEMGVRLELQPQPHGKRTYLPLACHTLSKSEKISFCNCL